MKNITLEELLEAGSHFGHQITRHNPKSRDFVFEARDGIHIIDLAKTKQGLDEAAKFINELAQKGGNLLVVGTKRQAQPIILEEVERARKTIKESDPKAEHGIFYVTHRWIGGTLTNFTELEKNFRKMKDLETIQKNPEERAKYTKKELGLMEKERTKLEGFYNGMVDMKKVPDALFIVDTRAENIAVRESQATNIATVGLVDTNADPHVITYPIPANDDAVGSIKLIVNHIIDAWIEGRTKKEEK